MFYFKLVTLIFGVLTISIAPLILFLPGKFKSFLQELLPEERAPWMWLPVFAYMAILILTWYMELTSTVNLSWVITLIFSLGLVKIYFLLFRYSCFREMVLSLVDREKVFQWGFGSLCYVMGIFFLVLGIYGLY